MHIVAKRYTSLNAAAAEALRGGAVGMLPTDTLYGLVASATSARAVARVYQLKRRSPTKPCIILIAAYDDMASFNISLTKAQEDTLCSYWPGPTSVVLPCGVGAPAYLHGGTHTLAFRFPKDPELQTFLKRSGPLIAPSANPEGLPPATILEEGEIYFGDEVDFYVDGGVRAGKASTLISLDAFGNVSVLRA